MSVSIIIPVWNREASVINCLQSLVLQEYTDFEIIIVDDGSTDGTVEKIRNYIDQINFNKIRLICLENHRGVCHCRNIGVREARGQYLAFLDSDCIADPYWLSNLISPLLDGVYVASSGLVHDYYSPNFFNEPFLGEGLINTHPLQKRYLIGCNMAVVRNFLISNPFDENLIGAEEDDLQKQIIKANLKIAYSPKAEVTHCHPINNFSDLLHYSRTRGTSAAQMFFKYSQFPRDLIFPLATLSSLALLVILPHLFLLFILIHILTLIFNDVFFKIKTLRRAIKCLPSNFLYSFLKLGFFARTILFRKDPRKKLTLSNWF